MYRMWPLGHPPKSPPTELLLGTCQEMMMPLVGTQQYGQNGRLVGAQQ